MLPPPPALFFCFLCSLDLEEEELVVCTAEGVGVACERDHLLALLLPDLTGGTGSSCTSLAETRKAL